VRPADNLVLTSNPKHHNEHTREAKFAAATSKRQPGRILNRSKKEFCKRSGKYQQMTDANIQLWELSPYHGNRSLKYKAGYFRT
jgi:hypothetical protein